MEPKGVGITIVGDNLESRWHLTGRIGRDEVLEKLAQVDREVLGEMITPLIESVFVQENCLGGVLIVASVADKEETRYTDIDMIVIFEDPKRCSRAVADRLIEVFRNHEKFGIHVRNRIVPSPTGGELVSIIFLKGLPENEELGVSSVFEIFVCASFEDSYDDYLKWLTEENISHCVWLEKEAS